MQTDTGVIDTTTPQVYEAVDGTAEHEPNESGAVAAIAGKPFGYLLLWLLVIGFGAYGDRRRAGAADRPHEPRRRA
jgi:hypothetical protein